MTRAAPPTCQHPTAAGTPCPRPSVAGVDPDGLRRCYAHSKSPEYVAKREVQALTGRLAGQQQRGVPRADRGAVAAGLIPRPAPIPIGKRSQRRDKRGDEEEAPEAEWPVDLDLASVAGDSGQLAWRAAVIRNVIAGAIDKDEARVILQAVTGAAIAQPPKTPTTAGDKRQTLEDVLLARLTGG